MVSEDGLEVRLADANTSDTRRKWVDTLARFSYSVSVGTFLDWKSGLQFPWEWATNRGLNTTAATVTGERYGKVRNYFYRKFGAEKYHLDLPDDFISAYLRRTCHEEEEIELMRKGVNFVRRFPAEMATFFVIDVPLYIALTFITRTIGEVWNGENFGMALQQGLEQGKAAALEVSQSSWWIAPTQGWVMDRFRERKDVETAPQQAYNKSE